MIGVPSGECRLTWLRSQIIGRDAMFDSPFGRRRLTYADHTASGRCLHYVEDFVADNVLPFYGKSKGTGPVMCGSMLTGFFVQVTRTPPTATLAACSAGRGAQEQSRGFRRSWASLYRQLCEKRSQSLAEVIEIGQDSKGSIDMEELRRKLRHYRNANRPILGSFSACSNVTGKITDTRALAKLLHEFEGFACFDFAASGPYAKIDMKSGEIDGYDAIFLSPHKFLGGPGSPGILLASKTLYCLGSSPPSTCGGGTVTYVNGFNEKDTLCLEEIEGRENGGTPPIIQITRLALAFWVKDYVGGLEENGKLTQSTIAQGYQGVKPGKSRISFPYYMSEEEFHFVLEALEFVTDYGQIFLPLYVFDIRTGGWTIRRKALAELLSKEKKGSTQTSPPWGPVGPDNISMPHNDNIAETLRDEYDSYFEQARRVAGLLQEFPLQRTLGEDMGLVDQHLVYFRI
ncbi:hypothetical protein MLD38_009353 [Melastoma candidum]|uniref:Uncharacterized protein n=1 Tax=Melastoma candidum TaxID=119954 RepID=A0ACB9S1M1_9MYRT|nr:hypothetical protein MLD38_009353 [Melastoma candidum]